MYCPYCGARNDDNATHCTNCGNVLEPVLASTANVSPQYGPQDYVPNYLVPAILTTLFCCLPFGIVSIVYAAQVDSKIAAGDRAGALESSRKARMWAWISFGAAIAIVIIIILVNVFFVIFAASSSQSVR